jgi:hypothetical protein
MEIRNSSFDIACNSLSRRNSIASTEFMSVMKLRKTQIFWRIFLLRRRSSLRVLEAGMSIEGNILLF